jgi:ring-1,2-phenylacetyl-CoA epoxidase subunit PaaE
MNITSFFENWLNAFIDQSSYYIIFSIPFFVSFWIIGKSYFQKIRIQEKARANWQNFLHDFGFSITSFMVFAVMDVAIIFLSSKGYGNLYFEVNKYGLTWLFFSFFFILFIDDTWFYWTHRAMHTPRLYKFFHKVHHKSTDPSSLTSYAFHPSEAIIENTMHFILPIILPLNFWVMVAWQFFSLFNTIFAHHGYELYPKGWVKLPILKYKVTSTHHNMHHQLFNGNYALYFTWWDKWMGTEFKDYETRHEQIFERKNIKKTPEGLYFLTVSAIHQEANDAFTIQFSNVPAIFRNFLAGQHLTIKVTIKEETLYRTFSISSIPNTDNYLTLTIKKIKGGKVTNYLAENLKVGDNLEVTAPSGQFSINPEPAHQKHYVMIAGGSGITPIYSMIGAILKLEPKSRITLLYANRTSTSIIFKEKIEQWTKEFPAQLEVKHFLSKEEDPKNAIKGYITRISLEEMVNQYGNSKLDYYLCGPEIMTNNLMLDLAYLGITKDKIHRELFLITTQTQEGTSQKAQVFAKVFGQTYEFETDEGKTILQSGLMQNVPLPFSCQSGLCGMCKMKCTEGKVMMKRNQVLTENELKEGYILTCQSLPQTKAITIKNP